MLDWNWSAISTRRDFLTKVFLTLTFQLLVTFAVVFVMSRNVEWMQQLYNWWAVIIIFLVMIGLMLAITLSKLSNPVKLLLFTIFSALFGLLLSPIGLINSNVLLAAAAGALGIFVVMFIAGAVLVQMNVDLSMLGGILFVALIALLIGTIVNYSFGVYPEHAGWVYFGLVLYSLFILFDTGMILSKKYGDNYPAAAMDYYIDIIGVFLRLLELIGRSR